MSLVARAAVALLPGLVLAAGVGAPAVARPAETVPIPGVGELGHPSGFIGDKGELVLLAKDDGGQVHLLVGKSPSSMGRVDLLHAAEGLFQSIAPLPNNRFVLRSVPDDGSSHGGPISTQVYRFRGTSAPKLLWTGSEADYELSPIRVSADGKLWGVMAPSFASEDARERLGVESPHVEVTSGIHFAFGTFKSSKARRTHTLAFHDWIDDRDIGLSGQSTRFIFLDSDGPVLVTSYADDVYLLRFTDSGVVSEELEPMKPLMAAVPGGVFFRWQDEDRVLWCGGDGDWLAWNLWDLGLSGFPEEPFLRFSFASGSPHRARGFVKTVRDGSRYRVEHLWQSPDSPNWRERHVSEWLEGTPVGPVDVSPNGRHGLAFEQRAPDEGGKAPHRRDGLEDERKMEAQVRYYARRFELFPAPVESPAPAP